MATKSKTLFAAIDVGSFEMCLAVYEISKKGGLRLVDLVRHRLALGADSYTAQKISAPKMEELFRTLKDFQKIMKGYGVTEYKAYGTSALREIENTSLLLDQIRNISGIEISILSNSEQRFLDYKAIAARGDVFEETIKGGTAIVDIGGGSVQLSLFDEGRLITTQSLKLGVLRIHESLQAMQPMSVQIEEIMDEMIGGQLRIFKKIYMQDLFIGRLILMDDYLSPGFHRNIRGVKQRRCSAEDFAAFMEHLHRENEEILAGELEIPEEGVALMKISAGILQRIIRAFDAKEIWAPGATLCDGIVYEYIEKSGGKTGTRDFDQDIYASAVAISQRYMGSRKRGQAMERIALAIFDGIGEQHGMGQRERLLLRLSTVLHDCGKFINMTNVGECSYSIISNTEIIGLSHRERQILAFIVKFNHDEFEYFDELSRHTDFDRKDYLIIAKLTAILRLANALDKSQKQKVHEISVAVKNRELVVSIEAGHDILFEKDRFIRHGAFFEEVYGLHPRIRRK